MEHFSSPEQDHKNPAELKAEKQAEIRHETCDRVDALRQSMGPLNQQIIDKLFSCEPKLENKSYVAALQMALNAVMKARLGVDGRYGLQTDACVEAFCQKYQKQYGESLEPNPLSPLFPKALKKAIEDANFNKESQAKMPLPRAQVDAVLARALMPQVDNEGTLRRGNAGLLDRYGLAPGTSSKPGEEPVVDLSRPPFGERVALYFPELGIKTDKSEELFGKTPEEMALLSKLFRESYLENPARTGALVNYRDPAYREADSKYPFITLVEQDRLADRQYAWGLRMGEALLPQLKNLDRAKQTEVVKNLSTLLKNMAIVDTKLTAMEKLYKNKTEASFSDLVVVSHRKDFLQGSLQIWDQVMKTHASIRALMPSAPLDSSLAKMASYHFHRLEMQYAQDPSALALVQAAKLKVEQSVKGLKNERV